MEGKSARIVSNRDKVAKNNQIKRSWNNAVRFDPPTPTPSPTIFSLCPNAPKNERILKNKGNCFNSLVMYTNFAGKNLFINEGAI